MNQEGTQKRGKRNLMWWAAGALIIAAAIGLWTVAGTRTVSLSKEMIQAQIDQQLNKPFPIKGKAGILIKNVTLAGATVDLGDGVLGANINIKGSMRLGKNFELGARAIGVPYYQDGAFYFAPQQLEITKFEYQGSSPAALIKAGAEKYLSNSGKMQQLMKDSSVKMEDWMTETAKTAAMASLGKNPVYRLKSDFKGMIIGASLKTVEVSGDQIVITFTLWTLTISVISGVVCLVLAVIVIFALANNPSLGVAFEVLSIFG